MNYAEISKETIGFLYQSRASLSKSPLNYSEKQIVDLTICIGIMNALNRIVIGLRD